MITIGDMTILQKAGISAAPFDAPVYVKRLCNMQLTLRGGEGVFREFVEKIISEEILKNLVEKYV